MTALRSARLRQALVTRLMTEGYVHDRRWAEAVGTVPREAFLGGAVFRATNTESGTLWTPLRRGDVSAEEWAELAYANQTWVTQVGGITAIEALQPIAGAPTSSSTLPGIVVRMLEIAQIADGDSVLEIGTGTGYSTALLCRRLGDRAVTSIEYDPSVARQAEEAISSAGYAPTLVVGDGLAGYDENAEYDRLIATCSVRYVPAAWLWQVRDGGTITTPFWGWMNGSGLVHLTLADDGTASGRFDPFGVAFMPARPHVAPPLSHYLIGRGEQRESRIDPNILDDTTGLFVAQLGAPSAQRMGTGDETVLLDVATGSQATTRSDGAGGWTVRQHGPLRLWDQVEQAVLTWQEAGRPPQSSFGLTITSDRQYVWLDDDGGPNWNLPA
ncbi:ATP-grasp peptide maturase system methyltransferase [Sphaerisporangium fuscum]|uniref:ATP-grasp peptide maturase system methyltransferase n=1 Tax=Sphaerisporangium fuscum TaxID=2835868 RepID=UPI0027E2F863|nr:ATP-grasp peptide maturase system methyltransferase [Sphaerisporangium fuscum]